MVGIVGMRIDRNVGMNVLTTEATKNSPEKVLVTTKVRLKDFSHQPGIGFLKLSASRILVLGVSGRKRFALLL